MRQSTLHQVIIPRHRQLFHLEEDNHLLTLVHTDTGEELAHWNATKVTVERIWEVCDELAEKYGS